MNEGDYLKLVLIGVLFAVVFLGGAFLGQLRPEWWREFFRTFGAKMRGRGFLMAGCLPAVWIGLFYGFVVHVWMVLGRWPVFGETLIDHGLRMHYALVFKFGVALFWAWIGIVTLVLLSVRIRRLRQFTFHGCAFAAVCVLAWFSIFFAPGPFLNWFLD